MYTYSDSLYSKPYLWRISRMIIGLEREGDGWIFSFSFFIYKIVYGWYVTWNINSTHLAGHSFWGSRVWAFFMCQWEARIPLPRILQGCSQGASRTVSSSGNLDGAESASRLIQVIGCIQQRALSAVSWRSPLGPRVLCHVGPPRKLFTTRQVILQDQ